MFFVKKLIFRGCS